MTTSIINGDRPNYDVAVLKGSVSRRLDDVVGNVVVLAAYCNILLNPVIYILRYDVVKCSLINWTQKIAAKFRKQQAPATS